MNKKINNKYIFNGDCMSLGLSLSGGGIKGAAHIGVLKALEEENIRIDYISGTSSGSIVATLYAIGYTPDEILNIFRRYGKELKYYDFKNLLKLVFGIIVKRKIIIEGLTDGKIIEKLMFSKCNERNILNIKNTKIPLLIPAVNMCTGEVYFFSSKLKTSRYSDNIKYIDNVELPSAVRASCGYPGVFTPYKLDGKKLIDGGVRENIPWKGLKEIGADKVISVVFEKQLEEKKDINIVDVIEGALNIMGHELANYELNGADSIITIKSKNVGLLQVDKIDDLYYEGYKQTKRQLKNNKNY